MLRCFATVITDPAVLLRSKKVGFATICWIVVTVSPSALASETADAVRASPTRGVGAGFGAGVIAFAAMGCGVKGRLAAVCRVTVAVAEAGVTADQLTLAARAGCGRVDQRTYATAGAAVGIVFERAFANGRRVLIAFRRSRRALIKLTSA